MKAVHAKNPSMTITLKYSELKMKNKFLFIALYYYYCYLKIIARQNSLHVQ